MPGKVISLQEDFVNGHLSEACRHRLMIAMLLCSEPLYKERSAVVNGDKEPPKAAEAAASEEPKQEGDAEPVSQGIPEFWLGVLRSNPVVSEHVSNPAPSSGSIAQGDAKYLVGEGLGSHVVPGQSAHCNACLWAAVKVLRLGLCWILAF
jgi:hypothetical protein